MQPVIWLKKGGDFTKFECEATSAGLCKMLKEYCEVRGYSQKQISDYSGVTPANVNGIINGKTCVLSEAYLKCCKAVGLVITISGARDDTVAHSITVKDHFKMHKRVYKLKSGAKKECEDK